MATERYQARGFKEEAYAEPTDRFTTFAQALQCALDDGTDQNGIKLIVTFV